MIGNNFLDIMMHLRFTGHQSYVLKLLFLNTQSYFPNQAAPSTYLEVSVLCDSGCQVLTSERENH